MSRTLILVVEDEPMLMELAVDRLRMAEYEVLEAQSLQDAVLAVRLFPELRLVLADLLVKGGTARDLFGLIGEEVVRNRRGLFLVWSGAELSVPDQVDPGLAPYARFFTEHGIQVFQKVTSPWNTVLLPFLERHRSPE